MKKYTYIIFFCIVFTSLFESCSNSEDNDDGKKKVISKILIKYLNNDGTKEVEATETITFSYLNGEVSKMTNSKNDYSSFNYENGKLLNITNSTDTANDDNSIINQYSGNQLTISKSEEINNELFYDSNNKLTEILTSYVTSNFTKKYSKKYYYSGNNINLTLSENFWSQTPEIASYKYDNKNNPFKNHNPNFKFFMGDINISENNVIEENHQDEVIKYSIIYDSDNFPIKVTGINQKTGKLLTEYTYQYINI